jgi:hypothetical protein
MKIPLDFFLNLIKQFCEDAGMDDVVKKLNNNMEESEESYVNILIKNFRMI